MKIRVGFGLPGVSEGDALEADLAVGRLGRAVGGGLFNLIDGYRESLY